MFEDLSESITGTLSRQQVLDNPINLLKLLKLYLREQGAIVTLESTRSCLHIARTDGDKLLT